MLPQIKSKVYSFLLKAGAVLYKDRHSKVIYYHDIHDVDGKKYTDMSTDFSLFKEHVKEIRNSGYEPVKHISKAENQIKIAFDDGFRGVYDNRNFFVENKLNPTVYIITEMVGNKDYMNWTELQELESLGFNIQAHSHSHADLNLLSLTELRNDLKTCKNLLETHLIQNINELCFPKGLYNQQVLEVAKEVGFTECYSSIPGHNEEDRELGILFYRNLAQFASVQDLKSILKGGMFIFKNRYRKQHYA